MRVAIVHYWLLNRRGGEAVLEALCRMFPEADLFTLFYDPAKVSPMLRARRIRASFLNPFRRWYRSLLPLMPLALEQFDLSGYDLVISSESGPAKGVLVPSRARHVCYCHTPMRYIWELYPSYLREWTPACMRPVMAPLAHYLRLWDGAAAQRVDEFVANSRNVAQRIHRCYRRESKVVHPPVAIENFCWKPAEDYFLIVSELVPYKRIDTAVQEFARSGRKLRIVGTGPDYRKLARMARGNIEFCGKVTEEELRELYAHSRALVMPGEEDFGITAVESLASGKPVIALGRGGVLEAAPQRSPLAGIFYEEPEREHLAEAIARFEQLEGGIVPGDLRRYAGRFTESRFREKMAQILELPGSAPAGCLEHGA